MASMWFHRGTVKVPIDAFYRFAVAINDKIYLLGFDNNENNKTVISQLDFETLKCSEIVSIDYNWACVILRTNLHVHRENIILFGPQYNNLPDKLLRINTITHQVDNIQLDHGFNYSNIIGDCVIKDHYYIIFSDIEIRRLLVFAVNLKTLEKKLIQSPNSPLTSILREFNVGANGTDICCFNENQCIAFIFNTVNEEWKKIDNCVVETNGKVRINQNINVNGELVVFKKIGWTQIFNFNNQKWRKGHFSQHPKYDWTFTKYFEFNGKIVTIKNTENALKSLKESNGPKGNFDNGDELEIYILDLNPSLETLCYIRIIQLNLDRSKLPKKLQHQLKKYINKT
ncbi:hypothetical protein CHUAL_010718 [Chamberlinius hualienensis]